jgi:1-acyl-sn-glycerol-3-phosphate acyltransferase
MSHRPLVKHMGYVALRVVCRLLGVTLFGMRCEGRYKMPKHGPVLVCANHQSYFDPVIVGLTFNRRLNYLARKSLFRATLFRWLIEFLDAIPIDREGLSMSGLKECLRRLRQGEMVLIFPEGTRTRDGTVGPLQSGFITLARRGRVALLPVGIDGAYDAWPRVARFPRLTRIHVCVGDPLSSDDIERLDDERLVAEISRRIQNCHRTARERRRKEDG